MGNFSSKQPDAGDGDDPASITAGGCRVLVNRTLQRVCHYCAFDWRSRNGDLLFPRRIDAGPSITIG